MALIQFWLIFLSRGDCPISRDNNISQSRMRREERQRSDCEWQGRLKKNEARSGNERASGNERFSARGSLNGRENGFALSCFDGRLASFRVARHARFRDGCAGTPPRGGGGERGGDAGEGVAFKPGGDDTLANRANARCPRIRFVANKTPRIATVNGRAARSTSRNVSGGLCRPRS